MKARRCSVAYTGNDQLFFRSDLAKLQHQELKRVFSFSRRQMWNKNSFYPRHTTLSYTSLVHACILQIPDEGTLLFIDWQNSSDQSSQYSYLLRTNVWAGLGKQRLHLLLLKTTAAANVCSIRPVGSFQSLCKWISRSCVHFPALILTCPVSSLLQTCWLLKKLCTFSCFNFNMPCQQFTSNVLTPEEVVYIFLL